MTKRDNPEQEGHVKEWQDRARVVIDAKEKVQEDASPRQSPDPDEPVEEKSKKLDEKNNESY